uniref:Uncharacterized protein n=1 Tax=Zea mays TaxID=4577 RepID=C4J7H7_MAIZE|nr:unknown [Zea mays]
MTPKENTSNFSVSLPDAAYSGAKYPKVPITLVETWVLLLVVNFASPKSATLYSNLKSRRMLDALMSRWMIFG